MHAKTTITIALLVAASAALGATNISPTNKWSWGENIGFMNWRDAGTPAGNQGVEVLSDHLAGYVWCENIGWLNVGNGSGPYANTNNTNYGVNVVGGFLEGYAWMENAGWVNFDGGALASPPNPARIENGRLKGFAWGENVGWINLDDANAYVAIFCEADVNSDGQVNLDDLQLLLFGFGTGPGAQLIDGDVNGDGFTNLDDLQLLLFNFGNICY
ncbi:MAG: dockerin type I repeat-containing protein [Phycisphaerales bacterium]|nr:dockerin type I repeat-containing protein [Phycisphaerales bacterium]